jgi:2-keto-4-pentenoate hydratase/2-oxohepta-3-ene-1,7-dioic acid hydratase in catechol pathway
MGDPDLLTRLATFAASEERFKRRRHDVRLDAPIRDVPKLLALAGNFRKHVEESGFQSVQPQDLITPQVFSKPPSTTINAPGDSIALRPSNRFLDWEVEVAIIIGRGGRNLSSGNAMSHVFGYSVINDVSERELNGDMPGRTVREFDPFFDWLLGKWFDGSAPLGPEIVTADEIGDPHALNLRLSLNGDIMQSSNTAQMIFDNSQDHRVRLLSAHRRTRRCDCDGHARWRRQSTRHSSPAGRLDESRNRGNRHIGNKHRY